MPHPGRFSRLGLLLLIPLLLSGCGRAPDKAATTGPFHIEVRGTPSPAALGVNRLLLTVRDGDRPLAGGEVGLRLFMDGMPMNTDDKWIVASGGGKGRYTAEVDFSMGGEWTMVVAVRRGQEAGGLAEAAQVRIPYTIVWELP